MDNKKIGATIYNLRKSLNLTQSELANKIFVSNKAISRWETGEGIPDISNLNELSKLFNVTIDYIIKGEGANGVDVAGNTKNASKENAVVKTSVNLDAPKNESNETNNLVNKNNKKDEHINEIIKQAENRIKQRESVLSNPTSQNNISNKTNNKTTVLSIFSLVLGVVLLSLSLMISFSIMISIVPALLILLLSIINIIISIVGISVNKKGSSSRVIYIISLCVSIATIIYNVFFGAVVYMFFNGLSSGFNGGVYFGGF